MGTRSRATISSDTLVPAQRIAIKSLIAKFKWPIVAVGAIVACFLVSLWLNRPTLASICRRELDCLAAGDGGCLYNLTTNDERLAYGLTREKVNQLMSDYFMPVMRPLKRSEFVYDGLPEDSKLMAHQQWVLSSGKETEVGVFVSLTDEGIKCPYSVGAIILTVAKEENREPTSGTKALDKLRSWRDAARKDKGRLEQLGFAGLYRSVDEGLILWDDWAANCDKRIESLALKPNGR